MAKTVDVPTPLRAFNTEFNKLSYKYDTADVFSDLIDLMIAFFKYEGDKELGYKLKKEYKNDYEQLCICVREIVKAYQIGIGKGDDNEYNWYDGIGEFYEVITSSYKSSRLGQFFTPAPICELMAAITVSNCQNVKINDPCCGSGRMLLATGRFARNSHFFATDIDQICTKMTAINMCIHGLVGQVVCADALWYGDSWRFGYQINDTLKYGLPSIRSINQDECFQSKIIQKETKITEVVPPEFEVKIPVIKKPAITQLTLF